MARLTSELVLRLIDEVSPNAGRVQRALASTRSEVEKNRQQVRAVSRQIGGTALVATGVVAALRSPVRAAMNFESAMADVRKVADFETAAQFDEFRASLLAMSRDIPLAVEELAALAAKGGEAGLRGDDLLQFVEMTAKLQVAFGTTADAAGDFITSVQAGLNLTLDDTLLLSDAVNDLSNNFAATAPDMMDFMTRVAADAAGFGFAAEEAAAFGAAMIAVTKNSEVSATSFRNMGRALTRGESATKRQTNAMSALGLEAGEVARQMQEDAVGTTLDVIDRIAALPKAVQAATMSDLFGDEARALTPLLTNRELLRSTLLRVGDEATFAGSAFAEFAARSETFESDLTRFKNTFYELTVTIGEALLPILSDTMDTVAPIIRATTAWAKENRELVARIVQVTGAVFGLRLGFLGLKLAGLLGKGGVLWLTAQGLSGIVAAGRGIAVPISESLRLQSALAGMGGSTVTRLDKVRAVLRGIAGITGMSAVASGLGSAAAVVAGISAPVWATVAAVAAAIGAAGFLIYKNWDRISAIMRGVAGGIVDGLKPAFDLIRPVIEGVQTRLEFLRGILSPVFDGLNSMASSITGLFSGSFWSRTILPDSEKARVEASAREITARIVGAIVGLPVRLLQIGRDAITSLGDGMREKLTELLDWVKGIPGRIGEAVGSINLGSAIVGSIGATSGSSVRSDTRRRRRATGGPVRAGVPYLVNERTARSEIMVPSTSGAVLTVSQAKAALRSTMQGVAMSPRPGVSGLSSATATGGGSSRSINVRFGDINITGAPGGSVEDLAKALGDQISAQLQYNFSD
ncbi:hypothetical protein AN189_07215 [Loktanella sp. 3ANDIMAR09]|uniref:phage tail tape measure protein n=1 Tax=Loktanella sp. 3ANDIMAR09 TaxID=1225657 RepID=UPI0006FF5EBA|nr:phage tail tape measure protein [Loktanella sp. 3ANDIMAR09]KQI68690.1 hypothetical protein AN189_07215 [Loktanella sp. 3ANDIMAR09]